MGATERDETTRAIWQRIVTTFDASRMVYVDESGATIALARRYGRAPKGERVYGAAPRNYQENLTLIAALTLEGIEAPFLPEGAVDGVLFERYVEQILVPGLRPGQVGLLDNSVSPCSPALGKAIHHTQLGVPIWQLNMAALAATTGSYPDHAAPRSIPRAFDSTSHQSRIFPSAPATALRDARMVVVLAE